ncbi:protein IQ-DOMAIN 14 [Euphorbia lathyris]|uniref:protein IQ-DOMAIN 14 n=1 Tax=Euphorbia lathyris TaxID=212925 RepID=UPI003313E4D5
MGKKGSWFSAIKKVFLPHSKDKVANESDKKSTKEKKKGKLRHGDTNSFIPLFREPSSIEKILDEAEREHKLVFRPPTPPEQPKTPLFVPRAASPRNRVTSPKAAAASPRVASPRVASPRPPSPKNVHRNYRPEPTLRNQHASATKIQAAYRGYNARRSFRALKGLVRLQGVVRGQSVKRQTMNAMKYMQMLVRVQSQIQSRRIQMLENQARRQAQYKNDKEVESILGKWSLASEAGNEDWDASTLTKEENDARLQKKVDALIKRERAMAYAYSHQLWKSSPKTAQSSLADVHSNGFPWWWNWLERQLPPTTTPDNTKLIKKFQLTPSRLQSELKPSPSPRPSSSSKPNFAFDAMDTPTPRSSKSVAYFPPSRYARTPVHRTTPPVHRSRAANSPSPFNLLPLKDDDSMTSCPPFSAPNYMAPTMSARAKARANSNPKERFPGTPSSEKRRLSFPLTQGIGSFKWNKGSFFSGGKDSSSQRGVDKNQSTQSIGNLSVDSTVSMPAAVGRKPFNRFV